MKLFNFNKVKLLIAMAIMAPLFFLSTSSANACGGFNTACGIKLGVNPGTPDSVLNDGTHSVENWWIVTYESAPVNYIFKITKGADCGPNTPAVPGTELNVDMTGHVSPIGNPEWSNPDFTTTPPLANRHLWNVPAGQAPGLYCAQVAYYSNVGFDSWAAVHFYISAPTDVPEFGFIPGVIALVSSGGAFLFLKKKRHNKFFSK